MVSFVILIAIALGLIIGTTCAYASDLAVGDSIALGAGQALHVKTAAVQNDGSCAIVGFAPGGSFDHVVISAGINDAPGSCDEAIRKKYIGAKVVWILPAAINSSRAHVVALAKQYGDKTVSYRCAGGCSTSNFHPASYFAVAAAVRSAWGQPWSSASVTAAKSVVIPAPPTSQSPAVVLSGRSGVLMTAPTGAPVAQPSPAKSLGARIHDFFFPAHAQKISAIIDEESAKEGVPAALVKRIAAVESRGDCQASASDGKSSGVMQVRPETARAMGVSGDQKDCRNSVVAGVRFLKLALNRAHGDWEQAATFYNHGLMARIHRSAYSHKVMTASAD